MPWAPKYFKCLGMGKSAEFNLNGCLWFTQNVHHLLKFHFIWLTRFMFFAPQEVVSLLENYQQSAPDEKASLNLSSGDMKCFDPQQKRCGGQRFLFAPPLRTLPEVFKHELLPRIARWTKTFWETSSLRLNSFAQTRQRQNSQHLAYWQASGLTPQGMVAKTNFSATSN